MNHIFKSNPFPNMVIMTIQIFDENKIKDMPDEDRFHVCEEILKNESDESKRWDAVWIVGELADDPNDKNKLRQKVADILEWTLKNDTNGVVKHEASFQIAARNLRDKIPILVDVALNDKSLLSKHEAIESLGLMRAYEVENLIKKAVDDPSIDVRETAEFVLKRFKRLKNHGDYKPSNIL